MIKKNQAKTARFNFWPYFKSQKLLISIWLSLMIIDIGVQTFIGIFSGYILANISTGLYILAIKQFAIMCIVLICTNIMQFFRGIIYCRVSNKITNDMRIDIANQAFKIADKSYTDHKTSNFTQRISSDPQSVFDKVYSFVGYLQQIITAVIMIGYIAIISWLVGVIAIGAIIIVFAVEKVRRKIDLNK